MHFPFLFSQFIFFPYICRGTPRTARAAHPPRIHETIPASAYRAAVADPGGPRRERTGFAAPDARPRHRGTESPHGPQGGAAPRAETAAGRAGVAPGPLPDQRRDHRQLHLVRLRLGHELHPRQPPHRRNAGRRAAADRKPPAAGLRLFPLGAVRAGFRPAPRHRLRGADRGPEALLLLDPHPLLRKPDALHRRRGARRGLRRPDPGAARHGHVAAARRLRNVSQGESLPVTGDWRRPKGSSRKSTADRRPTRTATPWRR